MEICVRSRVKYGTQWHTEWAEWTKSWKKAWAIVDEVADRSEARKWRATQADSLQFLDIGGHEEKRESDESLALLSRAN